MTPETARRILLGGLLMAVPAAAATAGEDPADLPPSLAPAMTPPIVRPSPVVVEPPNEVVTRPEKTPLDPVATARKGPHFVRKKVRSWHWRRLQGKMLGYPEEFKPRPLGASVYAMGRTMASNGAEARLALHDFDFVPDSPELTERGRDQLAKIAAQLAVSPFPLIVERTPDDPALAAERRRIVIETLAAAAIPIDADRVLIGQTAPFGMSGNDARIVGVNSLTRTQGYGPPIPLNSNGINSASGVTSQGGGGQ